MEAGVLGGDVFGVFCFLLPVDFFLSWAPWRCRVKIWSMFERMDGRICVIC